MTTATADEDDPTIHPRPRLQRLRGGAMHACCRHPVDDHGPAGCCECRCRLSRADHPARPEVDGLGDWRRAASTLARWTTSLSWLAPPSDTSRPGPVAGEIGS